MTNYVESNNNLQKQKGDEIQCNCYNEIMKQILQGKHKLHLP